jgi:hypothetical protein
LPGILSVERLLTSKKKNEAVSKGQPLWFYERAKKRGSRSIPHLVQVAILLVCAKSKVVFKNYTPNQVMMLPPSLEELITANHPVRIVNQVIDRINIDPLLRSLRAEVPQAIIPGCC